MVARTDLETSLHRLANHVECQLAQVFCDLLAECRAQDAQSISYAGCNFVESLREARDRKEGGEV